MQDNKMQLFKKKALLMGVIHNLIEMNQKYGPDATIISSIHSLAEEENQVYAELVTTGVIGPREYPVVCFVCNQFLNGAACACGIRGPKGEEGPAGPHCNQYTDQGCPAHYADKPTKAKKVKNTGRMVDKYVTNTLKGTPPKKISGFVVFSVEGKDCFTSMDDLVYGSCAEALKAIDEYLAKHGSLANDTYFVAEIREQFQYTDVTETTFVTTAYDKDKKAIVRVE